VDPSGRADSDGRHRIDTSVAQAGITQFLDIGTGIPAVNNTHEVAQSVARAGKDPA